MAFIRGFAGCMSEVISFRLDKDNPRERQAFGILDDWCTEGFSVRHVMTGVLLKLNGADSEQADITLDELKSTLDQVNQLLEQLGNSDLSQVIEWNHRQESGGLTDNFIASIKKSAKKGMERS